MEKNNGQNDKYSHDHRNVEETSNYCKKRKPYSNTAGAVLYRKRLKIREVSPTYVYMHWTRNGDLLYIGVTNNLASRASQHQQESCWFRHVFKITHKKYPNLKAAVFAEERLILKHSPTYNNQYLPKPKKKIRKYRNILHISVTDAEYDFMRMVSNGDVSDIARDFLEQSLKEEMLNARL